jgi:prephenate dehydrogenase
VIRSALVVGSGLIGTSIALACTQKGVDVGIEDISELHQELAQDLIGGTPLRNDPDVIFIATPFSEVIPQFFRLKSLYPKSIVIEISGLKSNLLNQLDNQPAEKLFLSHPMAGRETTGPQSARADLFEGRIWILVPREENCPDDQEKVAALLKVLGATVLTMSPHDHDAAISSISHMPQLLSSLLGSLLADESGDSLAVSGQGVRDMTRLASSQPELWTDLFFGNQKENISRIQKLELLLTGFREALENEDRDYVWKFFTKGGEGKGRIPGKHGGRSRDYTYLPIVIHDKPGQLAHLFHECGVAGVNVEDLSIEHSPGQETGLITLALSEKDAEILQKHLRSQGWLAHPPRK